jgi:histidine kinase/DNA gyrase B/HSP90-like ATPase
MNLVLNAIEVMTETGGELVLKSELTDDGYLLVSIGDTRVGIPVDKKDEIFEAFVTTKPRGRRVWAWQSPALSSRLTTAGCASHETQVPVPRSTSPYRFERVPPRRLQPTNLFPSTDERLHQFGDPTPT